VLATVLADPANCFRFALQLAARQVGVPAMFSELIGGGKGEV